MSRKQNTHTGLKAALIVLMLVMIAATAGVIWLCLQVVNTAPETRPSLDSDLVIPTAAPTEAPPETTLPVPEHVVSTATIAATGDILMHMPVVNTGAQGDGSYNFDSIFQYLSDYSSAADFAAANLETTLCGTDNGFPYKGYPNFNCPDEIVDGAKDAGFDMLLTANNHSYDTGLVGYKRTLEVTREKGLQTLGTMLSADEPKYLIQDINGIQVGMLCYTYAYSQTDDGRPSLNGNPHISEKGICNYFMNENPQPFYNELQGYLDEMEAAGAEATVLFIHWGVEYQTYANDTQKAIAQKLCDMGIDVIIGGHPHVVQPVELLSSTTDPDHRTVCLYSMGNAVSNQRLGNISYINTAHTEDGVLFSVTFEKYSDGTVYLAETELIPTWVHLRTDGGRQYNILPLDDSRMEEWGTMFGISDGVVSSAQKSYDRTMAIVGEGLKASQDYLAQAKADREAYYWDLAYNPEKYATEATEPTYVTVLPGDTAEG